MFPVSHRDRRLPNKQAVFGVTAGNRVKAYPLAFLSDTPLRDRIGDEAVVVERTPEGPRARREGNGEELPGTVAYWFAWAAFHPGTELYKPR